MLALCCGADTWSGDVETDQATGEDSGFGLDGFCFGLHGFCRGLEGLSAQSETQSAGLEAWSGGVEVWITSSR